MPATGTKRRRRKRPGMPRRSATINRLTIRMDQGLYEGMNKICDRLGITQREFMEHAITAELAQPTEAEARKNGDLARTGMWIDPALVKDMDKRIRKEGTTQRALIERAVERSLRQHDN